MFTESLKFNLAVVAAITAIGVINVVHAQSSCTTLRQEPGVCVPILTCNTITDLLNAVSRPLPPSVVQLVQRSRCATINEVHYVCCNPDRVSGGAPGGTPSQATTTARPAGPGADNIVRRIGEKSESEIRAGMAILEATKCGKSDADRIANGEDAELSQYPWMALLVYNDGLHTTLDCGGSLITDQYVLTAAHCIRVGNKKVVSVRLGEHDLKESIDCVGIGSERRCAPPIQEINIEEALYHQDYSPSQFSNDIGVLRLVSKAVIISNVRPICLPITPNSKAEVLTRMIIAGWGRIENGLKASVLQKAVVPVKDNDVCQQIHKIIRITENQLCAGGENEVDTCKGDSGGPIFFSARYRLGARYVQYGVVSAGSSQCGTNFPAIYTRISSYLPWIAGSLRP